jgi:hypothetical protein
MSCICINKYPYNIDVSPNFSLHACINCLCCRSIFLLDDIIYEVNINRRILLGSNWDYYVGLYQFREVIQCIENHYKKKIYISNTDTILSLAEKNNFPFTFMQIISILNVPIKQNYTSKYDSMCKRTNIYSQNLIGGTEPIIDSKKLETMTEKIYEQILTRMETETKKMEQKYLTIFESKKQEVYDRIIEKFKKGVFPNMNINILKKIKQDVEEYHNNNIKLKLSETIENSIKNSQSIKEKITDEINTNLLGTVQCIVNKSIDSRIEDILKKYMDEKKMEKEIEKTINKQLSSGKLKIIIDKNDVKNAIDKKINEMEMEKKFEEVVCKNIESGRIRLLVNEEEIKKVIVEDGGLENVIKQQIEDGCLNVTVSNDILKNIVSEEIEAVKQEFKCEVNKKILNTKKRGRPKKNDDDY